jgi:hypothetical protein
MAGLAIATLLTSSAGLAADGKSKVKDADAKEVSGECHGVNSCKGKGECGGKGHSCAGKNSCKGKGWIKATKAGCDEKKGTFKADEQ